MKCQDVNMIILKLGTTHLREAFDIYRIPMETHGNCPIPL
jgi:hypothetical protein